MQEVIYSDPVLNWASEVMSDDPPSGDDPRFKFSVGDKIIVTRDAGGSKVGTIAIILKRRNGYPPPYFTGYWFPLYFLKHTDGSPGGGEIHEDAIEGFTADVSRNSEVIK